MTRTLSTLLRVSKHKLERAQEALGEAEKQANLARMRLREAEESRRRMQQEALVSEDVQGRLDMARYEVRLKKILEQLGQAVAAAEAEVVEKRAALTLVYAEDERYALLLAQEEQKIARRKAAKQQQELDDVAGQRARRE